MILLFFLATFLAIFFLIGKALDLEAERIVDQLFARNGEGIILGTKPMEVLSGKKSAIIFSHGFLCTPEGFYGLAKEKTLTDNFDIYLTLLPYCARSLRLASKFNNEIIEQYLYEKVKAISAKYESVVLVGYSYSGALVSKLAAEKMIPENCYPILYAPGVYIQANNLIVRIIHDIYGFWRKYCNYKLLKASFPAYESGDEAARPYLENERSLRYRVIPALAEMMRYDKQIRKKLPKIDCPISVIMSENDNRVCHKRIQEAYQKNPHCDFYSLPSGKHLPHLGKQKDKFNQILFETALRFINR